MAFTQNGCFIFHTVPPPLQQHEKKHLADFLEEYDDSKDDQKYYRGSAFARRRREREVEMEEDERDRMREKKEIESLRLKVSCVEVPEGSVNSRENNPILKVRYNAWAFEKLD